MQDKILIGLIVILSISSIILIGRGITGQIISQSCCFGSDCSAENLCDSAKPINANLEQPREFNSTYRIYFGIITLLTSMILIIKLFYNNKIRK